MTSVKDNFRLSGRREENQREVNEPGRRLSESVVGSGTWSLLWCEGTAIDGVVCSGDVLKSTSAGLGGYR